MAHKNTLPPSRPPPSPRPRPSRSLTGRSSSRDDPKYWASVSILWESFVDTILLLQFLSTVGDAVEPEHHRLGRPRRWCRRCRRGCRWRWCWKNITFILLVGLSYNSWVEIPRGRWWTGSAQWSTKFWKRMGTIVSIEKNVFSTLLNKLACSSIWLGLVSS